MPTVGCSYSINFGRSTSCLTAQTSLWHWDLSISQDKVLLIRFLSENMKSYWKAVQWVWLMKVVVTVKIIHVCQTFYIFTIVYKMLCYPQFTCVKTAKKKKPTTPFLLFTVLVKSRHFLFFELTFITCVSVHSLAELPKLTPSPAWLFKISHWIHFNQQPPPRNLPHLPHWIYAKFSPMPLNYWRGVMSSPSLWLLQLPVQQLFIFSFE